MLREVSPSRILIGKLYRGEDLLERLTAVCREKGVRLGRIEAVGAVERARVGFYDQRMRTYGFFDFGGPMEILSLLGNISLKDGEPVVHAHIALSDAAGAAFGGHLAAGTKVYACEFLIQELAGTELHREMDEATGLPLWKE